MPRLSVEERKERERARADNERFLAELQDRRRELLRRLQSEPHPLEIELADVGRYIGIVRRGLERT